MEKVVMAVNRRSNDDRSLSEKNCFSEKDGKLVFHYDMEELTVEAWGKDSLRVRSTKNYEFPSEDWALLPVKEKKASIKIDEENGTAQITNGKITARFTWVGVMEILNDKGKVMLKEFSRTRNDAKSDKYSSLDIEAREFKPIIGGDYSLTARFESLDENEKIYGMGQYQQPNLNLKGTELELAQRNSQATVPFAVSSLGYGFMWNNPAVGRVVFGKNITTWYAESTKCLDYWVTVGDKPSDIEENYASVTGTVPMMPDYGMGFWQCKLRYQTQEELLEVARGYKKRGVPVSVIVIDYFHWPLQGEWKFDKTYWPDPDAMIKELKEMGIELMVSIWPTVDYRSENFWEMKQKGYLISTDRGYRISMDLMGNTVHFDATNPGSREYVWGKAKKNYYDKGVKIFWLDEAEPEYTVYDFDNYRYHLGPNVQIGNIYPMMYAQTFFDGMKKEGMENVMNLLRCAWCGSQRYGALVWSGDIQSSFESFRNQLAAGLNMGMAGIPWWTTDIGGFHNGVTADPKFHELLVRWFEWGLFCPVMRLHGRRLPNQPQVGTTGGAALVSGAPNEIWSFTPEVEKICTDYIFMREKMKPYITELMKEAHEKGTPVMRPLFYDFPEDCKAWDEHLESYMFGPDILVAPVMYENMSEREVYLPKGAKWTNYWTKETYDGGQTVKVSTPIEQIPFFMKDGKSIF